MPLKLNKDTLVELLYRSRVKRVGKNSIASFLKELCLLKASYFDLTAYVLCPLPPFQFDCLNPELLNSVLLDTKPGILNSCLLCMLADSFAILYVILVRSYSIPIFINDKLDPTPQSHCFCYTSYSNNISCQSHTNLAF